MSELKFNGLGVVLEWKYGPVASTLEVDGEMVITEWRRIDIPQPDRAQIKQDFKEFNDYVASIIYKEKRSKEYPPVGDQLDVLFKLMKDILSGRSDYTVEAQAMVDKIDAVKTKYPKP